MRKAFSVQSFWVLKSPEKIFFGCIQLALAWCPPLLKKAVLGRKEKGREERKEAEEKGKKRRGRCAAFLSLFAWKGGRSLQLHSRKGREGGHNSNEERESMTS